MADEEYTISKLTFRGLSSGEGIARTMSITVEVQVVGGPLRKFNLPSILHDELRHITTQFDREIQTDRRAALLTASDDFTVDLI